MKNHVALILFILTWCAVVSVSHAASASLYTRNGNEFALTGSSYLYEEPAIMTLTGDKFGVNHTGTLLLKNDWFLKEDVRFAYGEVEYAGSGIQSGVLDWYSDLRAMLGRDVQLRSIVLSPYIGFGYRYLSNDLRGYSSIGSAGYRRESNYYYLPLGVIHRMQMGGQAVLSTTLEYDYLLWGKQVTRLSDLIGKNGFVAAPDTTNRQNSGYGLRLSMMYEIGDWGFGPFFQYWDIADSAFATPTVINVLKPLPPGSWLEPKNRTTEYGIRLMFRF